MSGQIDRIRDDGGRRVGLRCGSRQHSHGVGDAERETASTAATGRNPSRPVVGTDSHGLQQAGRVRPLGETDGELFVAAKMQRDVATIVDVSAHEPRVLCHHGQYLFRDRACDRRHWRDEAIRGKWPHRVMHAARHLASQRAVRRVGGLAQQRQFFAKLIEQARKPPRSGAISLPDVRFTAARLYDQVNRTVLQMKPPAIGQKADLRSACHVRDPDATEGENI